MNNKGRTDMEWSLKWIYLCYVFNVWKSKLL